MSALPREALDANTASASLERLGFAGLEALCRESAAEHAPDQALGHDPRGNLPIAYSEARRRRLAATGCVVCDGKTCPAADVASLPGDDVAWLTPNFYPVAYPFPPRGALATSGVDSSFAMPRATSSAAAPALHGLHLVQWSSLRHGGGLIGADAATAAAIFAQLAHAEDWLLHHADAQYPESGDGHRGFVGVIKNRGRTVGGSVEHDHQQVLLSNLPFAEPPATRGLRAALLSQARPELEVERIDGRVRTLVPSFMRRPLHAFIVPEGEDVGWLHHLQPGTRDAVALAVARLSLAVSGLMSAAGREPAWNLIVHSGAGCGPLLELRAYTQPLGGYEHLGLYICEEQPATSAGRLRDALRR